METSVNNKCKAFSSLEQSKKLAGILPTESADMQWFLEEDYGIVQIKEGLQDWGGDCTIPCWSLATLLEEIPEVINFDDDESDYTLEILKEHELYYLSYGNPLRYGKIEIEPQENFVDACYELILKLHELKML